MSVSFRLSALVVSLFLSSGTHAVLINPDFETGDLSGWTLFATEFGVVDATVAEFDTTQDGAGSFAAQFVTGRSIFDPSVGPQGGGVSQGFHANDGLLTISLNVAVSVASPSPNTVSGAGGDILVFVDGNLVVLHQFGDVPNNSIAATALMGETQVSAGQHILTILFQRSFFPADGIIQYVDDVTLGGSALIPLPPTAILLASACVLLTVTRKQGATGEIG